MVIVKLSFNQNQKKANRYLILIWFIIFIMFVLVNFIQFIYLIYLYTSSQNQIETYFLINFPINLQHKFSHLNLLIFQTKTLNPNCHFKF